MKKVLLTALCISIAATSLVACKDKGISDEEWEQLESEWASEEESESIKESIEKEEDKEKSNKSNKERLNEEEKELEQLKKASVIYIKGQKIDLYSWKEKGINTIIDEIASTGVEFTEVSGSKTHDKSVTTGGSEKITSDDIKAAFRDMGDGYIDIEFGSPYEHTNYYITYNDKDETLSFKARIVALGDSSSLTGDYDKDDFAIADKKYNIVYLLDMVKESDFEKMMQESGAFTNISDFVNSAEQTVYKIGSYDIYQNMSVSFEDKEYTFRFSGYNTKLDESEKENVETDIKSTMDRLGKIQYNGKEFDFSNYVDTTDTLQILNDINDFGFTNISITIHEGEGSKEKKQEFTDKGLAELAEIFDDGLKNKTDDYSISIYAQLYTNSSEAYDVSFRYGYTYFDGKLYSKYSEVTSNNDYEFGVRKEVTYTKDKIDMSSLNTEGFNKMIEGLTGQDLMDYYLEDGEYKVNVNGIRDIGSLNSIEISKSKE